MVINYSFYWHTFPKNLEKGNYDFPLDKRIGDGIHQKEGMGD
jgi:hypothetical protein